VLLEALRSRSSGVRSSGAADLSVLVGCRLVEDSEGVGQSHDGGGGVDVVAVGPAPEELRVSAPMPCDLPEARFVVLKKSPPAFTYLQSAERVWPSETLPEGAPSERTLTAAGALAGLCVVNQCQLSLPLAPLFFQCLLRGPQEGRQRQAAGGRSAVEDLLRLDPAFAATVDKVQGMNAQDLRDASAASGLQLPRTGDLDSEREAYLEAAAEDRLSAARTWQIPAVGRGFFSVVPRRLADDLQLSPEDLVEIVCGIDDGMKDFDFRRVFRVVMDSDLEQCEPLQSTFWRVVDSLEPQRKRQLLTFITGIDKLPAPRAEKISIDMPFVAFGLEDYRRALEMIPQSHTCDNILELPNYWEALQKTKPNAPRRRLEEELESILRSKLDVAMDNASGYGLDAVENQSFPGSSPQPASRPSGHEPPADRLSMSGNLEVPSLDAVGSPRPSSRGSLQIPQLPSSARRSVGAASEDINSMSGISSEDPFSARSRSSTGAAAQSSAAAGGGTVEAEVVEEKPSPEKERRDPTSPAGGAAGEEDGYSEDDYEDEFDFEEDSLGL